MGGIAAVLYTDQWKHCGKNDHLCFLHPEQKNRVYPFCPLEFGREYAMMNAWTVVAVAFEGFFIVAKNYE